MTTPAELIAWQDALCETGRMFHQRGWSLGTSSNYSVVLQQQPLQLLVTASGKHKGRLTRNDFVQVGADGKPLHEDQPKSSAETLLHVAIAHSGALSAVERSHLHDVAHCVSAAVQRCQQHAALSAAAEAGRASLRAWESEKEGLAAQISHQERLGALSVQSVSALQSELPAAGAIKAIGEALRK